MHPTWSYQWAVFHAIKTGNAVAAYVYTRLLMMSIAHMRPYPIGDFDWSDDK